LPCDRFCRLNLLKSVRLILLLRFSMLQEVKQFIQLLNHIIFSNIIHFDFIELVCRIILPEYSIIQILGPNNAVNWAVRGGPDGADRLCLLLYARHAVLALEQVRELDLRLPLQSSGASVDHKCLGRQTHPIYVWTCLGVIQSIEYHVVFFDLVHFEELFEYVGFDPYLVLL